MQRKPMNERKDVIMPPNAFSFYVYLYCSRNNSESTNKYSSNIAAATRSWLSLNESEKQQIESKFQECRQKYRLQILNQLKNAEPFMKIKNTSNIRKSESPVNDLPANKNENVTKERVSVVESEKYEEIANDEPLLCDTDEQLPLAIDSSNYNCYEQNDNIIEDTTSNNEFTLMEPIPPSVKTGHELFCMLTSADQINNIPWSALPQLEKKQYSRAVSLLKKDYISKYNEYLESLTPKQLFDHYHKIIS